MHECIRKSRFELSAAQYFAAGLYDLRDRGINILSSRQSKPKMHDSAARAGFRRAFFKCQHVMFSGTQNLN